MESTRPLLVQGVVDDPYLVAARNTVSNSEGFSDDERGEWRIDGPRLSLETKSMNGSVEGSSQFYWLGGSAMMSEGMQADDLESRAWDEPIEPTQRVVRRHVVWYVLRTDAASGSFSFAGTNESALQVIASAVDFDNATSVGFDRLGEAKSTLQPLSGRDGSSVWMQGILGGALRVREAPARTYTIYVQGHVAKVTVGGTPVSIADTAPNLVLPLSVAVLVILLVFVKTASAHSWAWILHLFSRLRREDLLEVPLRRRCLETVAENPGLSFSGLRRKLGSYPGLPGSGVVLHHLQKLEKFGYLHSVRQGRSRLYFPSAGFNRKEAADAALLLDSQIRSVLAAICDAKGLDASAFPHLGTLMGVGRTGVLYHIERLRQRGWITKAKSGARWSYLPTALGVDALRHHSAPSLMSPVERRTASLVVKAQESA